MKDSKLFEAIQTLDKKAFVRFIKFLRSPYQNEHEHILLFADLLEDRFPEINDEKLPREQIGAFVFVGRRYNDLKVRHLMSDMLKLFEQFVALEIFFEDGVYLEINKLSYFRDTGLSKHFLSTDRQIRSKVEGANVYGNEEAYYKKFLLERELNQFLSEQGERKGSTNVMKASEALDHFFILQKLRYGCMQANYGKVFSQSYHLFLLEEILDHVKTLDLSNHPLIQGYFLALMLFKNPENEDYFLKLREVLKVNNEHFSLVVNVELYRFAQNYCIGKINSGSKNYLEKLFDIYDETLSNKVALINGELSHVTFKNIVAIACGLEKFEWVEHFISDFGKFLPEAQMENSIAINTALLYWHRRRLSDAVRLLSRVEFDDPFYALNAKSLLLKIYFEQNEKEVLLSYCESFKVYLKRNKLISKSHINNYSNLISYTSKLIKLKPNQTEKFNKIKKEIIGTKSMNNRQWLIEQLNRMEQEFIERD